MKRKVGSIRHLSHDAHNAATVLPMTADALGRDLEIRKKWNSQRVFNIQRRSLQRTLRDWKDTNRLIQNWRDAPHRYQETEFRPSQDAVHSAVTDPSQLPGQLNMMRRLNTSNMLKNHPNHARRSPD